MNDNNRNGETEKNGEETIRAESFHCEWIHELEGSTVSEL